MTQKRRRWLTALGLFAATAVGGIVAFVLARRRRQKAPSPEEVPVRELSARLRREAATQERRLRRQPWFRPGLGRARAPVVAEDSSTEVPVAPARDGEPAAEVSPDLRQDPGTDGSS